MFKVFDNRNSCNNNKDIFLCVEFFPKYKLEWYLETWNDKDVKVMLKYKCNTVVMLYHSPRYTGRYQTPTGPG